jgi:hypothetical protein
MAAMRDDSFGVQLLFGKFLTLSNTQLGCPLPVIMQVLFDLNRAVLFSKGFKNNIFLFLS